MNILLVEPDYKNKYPPMGLMKISTYHKNRGDTVLFYKGLMSAQQLQHEAFDRVYITSLFTFYYSRTMATVEYYRQFFCDQQLYFGGIMVTILKEKVISDTNLPNILTGLMTDSAVLGLNDYVNIDELPLDYGLLDEISYEYPAGDNYFSYATRGCPNRCKFCAVPTLEPEYKITQNLLSQMEDANKVYGEKRNILLLDNNIFNLDSKSLQRLVEELQQVGFTKQPTFVRQTPLEQFLSKYINPRMHYRIVEKTLAYIKTISTRIKESNDKNNYDLFLDELFSSNDVAKFIYEHRDYLLSVTLKYSSKRPLQRYVDFNQGLEAARITDEKMQILAQLPLRPVRIAFDHYNQAACATYTRAVNIAYKNGVLELSNYMLYNYDDSPEDLWNRLKVNVELAKSKNVHMFSFPMKYVPITEIDRNYIGPHWNRHFLRSIQAILLVTKGIVASGDSFFSRAFGKSLEDFFEILSMPKDFIIYRNYYENIGLTSQWRECYQVLAEKDKTSLLIALESRPFVSSNPAIAEILKFYQLEYAYMHIVNKAGTE